MPNSSPQPDPYDAPKPTVAGSPLAEDSLAKTSGGSREEPTLNEVWDLMRAALKELIPHTPFYTWFQQATLRERQGTHLVLAVQNDFTCNWLLDHYAADIQRAAKRVVGPDAKVDIIVDAELAVKRTPRQRAPQPASQLVTHAMERPGLLTSSDVVHNPDYTFDKYVVGPCNRFAHAAAMGVSEAPGRNSALPIESQATPANPIASPTARVAVGHLLDRGHRADQAWWDRWHRSRSDLRR